MQCLAAASVVVIYHGKFQFNQIQNGRPAATFDFIMFNINWKIVSDRKNITIKQNVRFQGGACPEKCQLD